MPTSGIAVPGTIVPGGSQAAPGGAQGIQGTQGTQGPPGASSSLTGINSVLISGSNVSFVNDSPTPGNDRLYGTTSGGVLGWRAVSALPVAYASLTGVPTTFTPGLHAATHAHGGSDPVTITYSDLAGIPATFAPSVHAASHKSGGSDLIALDTLGATTDITTLNTSVTAHGLCPKAPNSASLVLLGTGLFGTLLYTALGSIPTSFSPSPHAATHESGGSDAIPLDTFGATTDITTLNASATAHGLLRKLDNTAGHYLDGTGTWSTPPGANYTASQSITLTATNFTFTGDVVTPLANQFYGYVSGARGWFGLTYSMLSGVPTNTTAVAGIVPTAPNDATKVWRGDASWAALSYSSLASIPTYVPSSASTAANVWTGTPGWAAISGLAVAYGSLTGVPGTFAPSAHAVTHKAGGSDLIALDTLGATTDITSLNVSTTAHGLAPKAPNDATQVLRGDGIFGNLAYSALGSIPSSFNPSPHAVTHKSGGSDLIALDTLGATTDIVTLNASTTAHGLLRKLDNVVSHYLDGTGTWSTPPTPLLYTGINSVLISGSNISLVNDSAAPGNNFIYGTSGTGVFGWRAISALPVAYSSLSGVPTTFSPSAHASTHNAGGSDILASATATVAGLVPTPPNSTGQYFRGDASWQPISSLSIGYAQLTGVPTTFAPSAHAISHKSGGADAIALDTLAATTDITTLNASTSAHGLLRKLDNVASHYLDGTGGWTTPPPGNVGDMTKAVYDTNADNIVDHAALSDTAPWTGISGKPANFVPSAHAATHVTGGSDLIPAPTTSASGLVPPIPNDVTKFYRGDGVFAAGPTGPAGPAGANAFTATAVSSFTVPAVGATTTVNVADASWIIVGQLLYFDTAGGGPGLAGLLQVTAKTGNLLTILNPPPPS